MCICTFNARASHDRLGLPVPRPYTRGTVPRRKKLRYCRGVEGFNLFKPAGIPLSQLEIIELGLDELEAMRLCDLDGKQQEEAARAMGVSRGTIQRLLQSGREKLLTSITEGQALSFGDADHVCISPRPGWERGRHGRRHGCQGMQDVGRLGAQRMPGDAPRNPKASPKHD
jgi:predicted DNA-binding protein (UPF0251 family)